MELSNGNKIEENDIYRLNRLDNSEGYNPVRKKFDLEVGEHILITKINEEDNTIYIYFKPENEKELRITASKFEEYNNKGYII